MQQDFGDLESPLSGSEFINGKLEPWRDTLHSSHSGDFRPTYAKPNMIWVNDTTDPRIINFFDGSNDIVIGYVSIADGNFTAANTNGANTSIDVSAFEYLNGTNAQLAIAQIDAVLADLGDLAVKDKILIGDIDSASTPSGHIPAANGSGGVAWVPNPAGVIASQAEAEAGTENTKIMTALRVRQALNAYFSGSNFKGWRRVAVATLAPGQTSQPFLNMVSNRDYMICGRNILGSAGFSSGIQLSTDNGASWKTASTDYASALIYFASSTSLQSQAVNAGLVVVSQNVNLNAAFAATDFDMTIRDPRSSTAFTAMMGQSMGITSGILQVVNNASGRRQLAEDNNAVRWIVSAGSVSSGEIELWERIRQ